MYNVHRNYVSQYCKLILQLSSYSNAPRSWSCPHPGANTIVLYMIPYHSPKSAASFAEWFGTCWPPGAPPLANLCWLGAIKRCGLKPFNPDIAGTTQSPRPAKPNGGDGRTSTRQTSGTNSEPHMRR